MKTNWKRWINAFLLLLCLSVAHQAQSRQLSAAEIAGSAQTRNPSWNYAVESGNWVNWTDISDNGETVLAGSFRFNKTGEFATFCMDKRGNLRWKDTLANSYTGVF